ncbi:MAG: riboflavin biosynthesis protein RibF [Clostridia bacterium]|nr:riboflavin biosynthesis protein RibF [Clostridia bacterium]
MCARFVSDNRISAEARAAVALGNFDGLHIGHTAVINACVEQAAGYAPVVLRFREHPMHALAGKAPSLLLTEEEERRRILAMGAQPMYVDFQAVKDFSPEEFVKKILVDELHAGFVSCGYNYHFGSRAAGDADTLQTLCKPYGIAVNICPKVAFGDIAVSSTAVRNALLRGDVALADDMLGYAYGYDFTVSEGDKRGRILGAPTINQFFPDGMLVPKFGVYASRVTVDGKNYVGVTNIGCRPTIGNSSPRSETYIENFSGDLYGQRPRVTLIKYMRPEIKFDSLDALSAQIAADAKLAAETAGAGL